MDNSSPVSQEKGKTAGVTVTQEIIGTLRLGERIINRDMNGLWVNCKVLGSVTVIVTIPRPKGMRKRSSFWIGEEENV